jgi:hypothetical protein
MDSIRAVAASTVATNWVPLVDWRFVVHAATSNASHEIKSFSPAGVGCEPGLVGAQVSEAEI